MSVQALSWVFEHSESRLADRHVLLSIANHARSDGAGAWPSVSTIVRESKVSETQVHRSIRSLQALGELFVDVGAGPKGTNLYTISKMMGCYIGTPGVPFDAERGAKREDQLAPEPSLTVLEPSKTTFDEFYERYPKHVGRKDAERAWKKIKPSEVPAILASVEKYKTSALWQRGYIWDPATFLNKRRWEDEVKNADDFESRFNRRAQAKS